MSIGNCLSTLMRCLAKVLTIICISNKNTVGGCGSLTDSNIGGLMILQSACQSVSGQDTEQQIAISVCECMSDREVLYECVCVCVNVTKSALSGRSD